MILLAEGISSVRASVSLRSFFFFLPYFVLQLHLKSKDPVLVLIMRDVVLLYRAQTDSESLYMFDHLQTVAYIHCHAWLERKAVWRISVDMNGPSQAFQRL